MSRRKVVSAVFTGVAATGGAIGFAAAPALAIASHWKVSNGGKVTVHNSASNIFKDVTHTGNSFKCPASHVTGKGSVPNVASKSNGNSLGKVSAFNPGTKASPCTGPLGFKFHGSGSQFSKWHINGSASAGGVVQGTITGIHVAAHGVSALGGSPCRFTASGSVPASYNNTTGVLTVKASTTNRHLKIVTATGCGTVAAGDQATYSGPLSVKNVAPATGHPKITHLTS